MHFRFGEKYSIAMSGWHGALIQCPSLLGPAYNLVQPEENNFDPRAVGGKKTTYEMRFSGFRVVSYIQGDVWR